MATKMVVLILVLVVTEMIAVVEAVVRFAVIEVIFLFILFVIVGIDSHHLCHHYIIGDHRRHCRRSRR